MATKMYRMTAKNAKGKRYETGGQFHLRVGLARHIPKDARFEPEVTEDGVLFRFVGLAGKKMQEPKPKAAWLGETDDRDLTTVALTTEELAALDRAMEAKAHATNGAKRG
jgi:hypothetical protein